MIMYYLPMTQDSNIAIGTSSYLMKHSHGKDLEYIITKAKEVTEYVKAHSLEVRFSGEDSFRSDFREILRLYSMVDRLGVNRVGIADTVGSVTPREVLDKIDTLRKVVGCGIEIHFHNDTGCAIANAYCALKSRATHIGVTVLGIGERNGITPLGGLLACLIVADHEYITSKYRIDKLGYIEKLVAQSVKVEIPFNNCNVSAFADARIMKPERLKNKNLAALPFNHCEVPFMQKFEATSLNKSSGIEG